MHVFGEMIDGIQQSQIEKGELSRYKLDITELEWLFLSEEEMGINHNVMELCIPINGAK